MNHCRIVTTVVALLCCCSAGLVSVQAQSPSTVSIDEQLKSAKAEKSKADARVNELVAQLEKARGEAKKAGETVTRIDGLRTSRRTATVALATELAKADPKGKVAVALEAYLTAERLLATWNGEVAKEEAAVAKLATAIGVTDPVPADLENLKLEHASRSADLAKMKSIRERAEQTRDSAVEALTASYTPAPPAPVPPPPVKVEKKSPPAPTVVTSAPPVVRKLHVRAKGKWVPTTHNGPFDTCESSAPFTVNGMGFVGGAHYHITDFSDGEGVRVFKLYKPSDAEAENLYEVGGHARPLAGTTRFVYYPTRGATCAWAVRGGVYGPVPPPASAPTWTYHASAPVYSGRPVAVVPQYAPVTHYGTPVYSGYSSCRPF